MKAQRMRYVALAGLAFALALAPGTVLAQSSIAGQVTDETGGVLPGVAVEAVHRMHSGRGTPGDSPAPAGPPGSGSRGHAVGEGPPQAELDLGRPIR